MAPRRASLVDRVATLEGELEGLRHAYDRDMTSVGQWVHRQMAREGMSRRQALMALTMPGALVLGGRVAAFGTPPELGSTLMDRFRRPDMVADSIGDDEPFAGQTNLLKNPTWEWGFGSVLALGTSFADFISGFEGRYVLTSGTAPTTRQFSFVTPRGQGASNPYQSAYVALNLTFGTAAADVDLVLREKAISGTTRPTLPWMVAQVRLIPEQTSIHADFTTVEAYVELLDSVGAVVAASDAVDLKSMVSTANQGAGFRDALVWTAYQEPTQDWWNGGAGDSWRWQMRVHVVKAAGAASRDLLVSSGEPSRQFAMSDGPAPYAPLLAGWWQPMLDSIPFALANVPASATTEMQPADNAMALAFPRMEAVLNGIIVGVTARFSDALTGGSANFQPTIAGTSQGTHLTISSGASSGNKMKSITSGPSRFAKGDGLGLQINTGGLFAPTTLECVALLFVLWEYDHTIDS